MRKLATYRDQPEEDPKIVSKMKKQVFQSESMDVALTKTQLIKRAGWNQERLDKFLGEPDFTTENSYRRGVSTSWYMMKRIEKAEKYKTFQKEAVTAIAQHEKRKAAAAKATATKKAKTLAKVEQRLGEIKLKGAFAKMNKTNLFYNALEDYNNFREATRWDFIPVSMSHASEEFLHRLAVNFLRHNGTTYDGELEEYFNSVGKQDAIDMVRKHIYTQIAEKYPYLRQECIQQAACRGIDLYPEQE